MSTKKLAKSQQIKEHLFGSEMFWANIKNVGYGYENKNTDVMLIQFFVNAALTNSRNTLEVDGRFGGKTWRAIKGFSKLDARG